jgi:ATP-dependent helicase/DNAse subunit B
LTKLLKVSYSHLNLFISCPYSAYLRYEAKVKSPTTIYLARGLALHSALERFHLETDAGLSFLVSVFKQEYNSIIDNEDVFVSWPQRKKYETEAIDWLETYHAQLLKAQFPRHPIAIEKEFSIPLGGIEIIGKIDRIDEGIIISDYKGAKAKIKPWDLKHNLQLTIYYYAAKLIYKQEPSKIIWWHLPSGERMETTRNDRDVEQLEKLITNAVKMKDLDIKHRVYNETCSRCPYMGDICEDPNLEVSL